MLLFLNNILVRCHSNVITPRDLLNWHHLNKKNLVSKENIFFPWCPKFMHERVKNSTTEARLLRNDILSLKWDVTTIDPDLKTFTYCILKKSKSCESQITIWMQCILVKVMNSRIRSPFFIFLLNPDYVAAPSLRSLAACKTCIKFKFWRIKGHLHAIPIQSHKAPNPITISINFLS